MKRLLVFLILLNFISISDVSYAQQKNGNLIGFVDFNLCVILHPMLCNYSPAKSAFKTIRAKNKKITAEETKKITEEINSLRDSIENLRKRISENDEIYEKEHLKIHNDYMKIMSENPDNKMAQINAEKKRNMLSSICDEKYNKKNDEMRLRLGAELVRLDKLEKNPNITQYTTVEETHQNFEKIIKDVYDAIKSVASKHKIQAVLNSSNERTLLNRIQQNNSRDIFPSDFFYNKIIYSNSIPEGKGITKEVLKKSNNSFYNNLDYWIKKEKVILNEFENLLPNSNVLYGGENITKEVLIAIFKKNDISNDVLNAILLCIE